jgi:HSP20 family protein
LTQPQLDLTKSKQRNNYKRREVSMAERSANQKSSEQKKGAQSQTQNGQSQAMERRSTPHNSLAFGMPQFLLDPFSMVRSISEEMNRMLSPSGTRTGNGSREGSQAPVAWVPTIEIEQRDGKYIVSAELPGLEEGDVTVEVDDDVLVIQGERQYEHEETEGGMRRTERRYGQFYRAIPLPDGVDPNQAEARINNGVLEVSFPLTQAPNERKQIPVTAGDQKAGSSQSTESGRNKSTKAA